MKIYNYIKPHQFREVFFIVLVTCFSLSFAQNKNISTFNATPITAVNVDGRQIFNIDVTVVDSDIITINSSTDGEYQNNFKVISEVKGSILHLALKRSTIDIIPDDKRNAHKVIAATLKIELPKEKSISIDSDIASVQLKGNFNTVSVQLKQGDFKAEATAKSAIIKTIEGNINVKTNNALIQTDSHNGLVNIPNNMFGFNVWELTTISGNITVKEVKF